MNQALQPPLGEGSLRSAAVGQRAVDPGLVDRPDVVLLRLRVPDDLTQDAGDQHALIVFSFIGVLVYLIAQGRAMAERRGKDVAAARAAFETDVQSIAGSGSRPTDEIAKAKQLRDSGDITAEEYETLKRRALSLPTSGGGNASTTTRSMS